MPCEKRKARERRQEEKLPQKGQQGRARRSGSAPTAAPQAKASPPAPAPGSLDPHLAKAEAAAKRPRELPGLNPERVGPEAAGGRDLAAGRAASAEPAIPRGTRCGLRGRWWPLSRQVRLRATSLPQAFARLPPLSFHFPAFSKELFTSPHTRLCLVPQILSRQILHPSTRAPPLM